MATRFLDKEYGADSSTAIADDATGTAKVKNLPDAAGYVYDKVDGFIKYNDAGNIRTVVNTNEAQTLTNKTLTDPVIAGIAADLTVTGTITSDDATTPVIATAAGNTNTGYLSLAGKTSGSLKILPADAMAQVVTIAPAAQTSGASTLGIPDQAGVNSDFVFTSLAQSLTNKTIGAQLSAGAGVSAAETYKTSVTKDGGLYITRIVVDLTGLVGSATDLDIIGNTGGAASAHFGQITAAVNGTIVGGQVTCLELPAGGADDIDFYSATVSTGAQDVDVTTLTETVLITSGGAWASGTVKGMTTIPPANDYLYIVNGEAAGGTFTAGKFLIELYGA